MVYRWEEVTKDVAQEFEGKVSRYKVAYKAKNGRSLPSSTKLIKSITLGDQLRDEDIPGYISLHKKLIGGEHLKTIKTDSQVSLIWFRGDEETLTIPRIGKKDLHKLRVEIETYIRSKKNWIERLFKR